MNIACIAELGPGSFVLELSQQRESDYSTTLSFSTCDRARISSQIFKSHSATHRTQYGGLGSWFLQVLLLLLGFIRLSVD